MQPTTNSATSATSADRTLVMELVPFSDRLLLLLLDQRPAFGELAEDVVEPGDHEDAEDGAEEHPAERRAADGAVADGAGARRAHQRDEARDERERRHQDR